jgi:large subunit ribosomal protein L22
MEVRSVHRYARISSQKARQVTRAITGMPVSQALNVLDFTPKKAAQLIGKVLRTAIANAENNHELDTEDMVVRSAVATPGPTLKRITPRARGSAGAIKKRLCHITVVLAAGKEESDEASSTTKAAVKKAAPRKRPAAKKAEQA